MRNLAEYPITKQEIILALQTLSDQLSSEESVGDMRPLLLLQALQYVAYGNPPVNELGLVFLDYTADPVAQSVEE